jgi:hypothetical protein
MITIGDDIYVDIARDEEHSYTDELTRYPVESGTDNSDHVHLRPFTLTVNGVVSDTPVGEVASLRTDGATPSEEVRTRLVELWQSREPVSVTSSLITYDNMVLTKLVFPRDPNVGHALRFRATFEQLEIVTNERTTVPVDPPRARTRTKRGFRQSPQESSTSAETDTTPTPEADQEGASVLYGLIH